MILKTKHQRKAFVITLIICILLLLLSFFVGMKYLDPPPEKGITITFGTDTHGMGEDTPVFVQENTPKDVLNEDITEEIPEDKTETSDEDILTQESPEELPSLPKETPKKEKTPDKPVVPKEEPKKPATETSDVLASILGATQRTDNQTSAGKGNDAVAGNKGSLDGNPYSNSYYGSSGTANGGNGKGWGLNGRNLLGGEKIPQECNESGRVVVQIEVDKQGKVVKVNAGVKGSTNTSPCLLEAAKQTALTYRWNEDDKAPARQVGFIEINFRVGE